MLGPGLPVMDYCSIQSRGEYTYSQLLHGTETKDEHQPDEPLNSYADFNIN